ncbi:MAG: adenylate/guanylate cyclase domain-containing protein [Chloroflexi bacterium]|nr:adenylate/guanylate cyclase domain-containing protein [Chloroflexota bacterium]
MKKKKIPIKAISLIIIAAFLTIAEATALFFPTSITPIERLDYAARDTAMRLRGIQPIDERIVIVAIDDFSFNWTGLSWPWPRTYMAEIVNYLNDAGAEVIGLDVFLFEEDPEGDQALAEAFSETPLSISLAQPLEDHQGVDTLKVPRPEYKDSFDALGITEIHLDDDATARSIMAYKYDKFSQAYFFNWALETARLAQNAPPISQFSTISLNLGEDEVPLRKSRILVNFRGPAETYPIYSAAQVVLGDYPAENFKDKIVLIGATSLTLQDVYPTPFSSRTPTSGVEIIASTVDSLLNQNYLRIAPPWVNLLFILLAAYLSHLIIRTSRPGFAIGLMLAGILSYGLIYFLVFSQFGLYLPFMAPEAMLFLGVIIPTLEEALSQDVEKRRIRNLFSRFISPEMVEQLISTQDINSLNKRSNITILFSDIRGFTTLSEQLTPDGVVSLLNPYLDVMTKVVHKYGGTVDKYEGDAIVAFFGEPVRYEDHALRAARAALDMRLALVKLTTQWEEAGVLPPDFIFDIGIGLNSGDVFVGLLGSEERVNYTIIGDNANLAARLQDLSKGYGWSMIISESTNEAIKDEMETEFIESRLVKGKKEAVKIYKLIGYKER